MTEDGGIDKPVGSFGISKLSRVSLSKSADPLAPAMPRTVQYAIIALIVSAIGSVAAGATLFTSAAHSWLKTSLLDANKKLKPPKSTADVLKQVDSYPKSALIQTLLVAAILVFIVISIRRGKHWSRWAVIGVWVLTSFVGLPPGIVYVLDIASNAPTIFKIPAFIAGIAMVAAVVLVVLKPSVAHFASNRPVRPARPAGRGLFGSRAATMTNTAPASKAETRPSSPARTTPATTSADGRSASAERVDRSRSKARASSESAAKGAELARSRAKAASKSRRTGS